jgi:L-rhamnose mutarotase
MSKADERNDITVDEYIASLDESLRQDTQKLQDMMQKISAEKPQLYGYGTIGFGVYKYEYTSGRKGEAHTLGFYPRKGKITVYLMDGTTRYAELLAKLGKHTITGYCIYIKQLSDVDLNVLRQILERSFKNITSKAAQGPIDSILWQSAD